ncbi:hypothetical protein WDW89_08250 [Deltaproteobacteria bacterium TL4]
MKAIINFKKIGAIFLLASLFGFSPLWGADPSQLAIGSLQFKIGDQSYSMDKAIGVVTQEGTQQTITVALSDAEKKIEVAINASVPNASVDRRLNTEYHDISFLVKTTAISVYVMPEVQLAKYSGLLYTERQGEGRNERFERKAPEWVSMTRAQRIATGQGVIRNKTMEGTDFQLNLAPVLLNGKIIELKGTFAGIVKLGDNSTGEVSQQVLNDGAFRVSVHQP